MHGRQRVADLFAATPLPVVLIDARARVVGSSAAWARRHRVLAEDIVGVPVENFLTGTRSGALDLLLAGTLASYEVPVRTRATGRITRAWVRGLTVESVRYALSITLPEARDSASLGLAMLRSATVRGPDPLRERLEVLTHELRGALGRPAVPGGRSALLDRLAGREREITVEILRGNRVPAIAKSLYLSPGTVRTHLSAVFRKLGVTSQQQLIDLLRAG